MVRQKKIATSWLLGGIAVICMGTTYAHAAGTQDGCVRSPQGDVTCTHKSDTTYTSDDGTLHVHQKQDCTSVSRDRVETPEAGTAVHGTTRIGPVVECSNTAPAPKGFTLPAFLR